MLVPPPSSVTLIRSSPLYDREKSDFRTGCRPLQTSQVLSTPPATVQGPSHDWRRRLYHWWQLQYPLEKRHPLDVVSQVKFILTVTFSFFTTLTGPFGVPRKHSFFWSISVLPNSRSPSRLPPVVRTSWLSIPESMKRWWIGDETLGVWPQYVVSLLLVFRTVQKT